jgi:hypothetical protein
MVQNTYALDATWLCMMTGAETVQVLSTDTEGTPCRSQRQYNYVANSDSLFVDSWAPWAWSFGGDALLLQATHIIDEAAGEWHGVTYRLEPYDGPVPLAGWPEAICE